MDRPVWQSWLAVATAALASVLLYRLSLLGLFFLLPLVYLRREGKPAVLVASVLAALGFLGVTWLARTLDHGPWTVWDAVDTAIPLLLLAGWRAVEELEGLRWRFLFRVGLVTGVAGLVVLGAGLWFLAQPGVLAAWKSGFDAVWSQVAAAAGAEAALLTPSNKDAFFELVKESVLGGFLPVLFLFWSVTEALGRLLPKSGRPAFKLTEFRMPGQALVPFLALWGLVLARALAQNLGAAWNPGPVWYVVENASSLLWLVYSLTGWAIVRSALARFRWASSLSWVLGFLVILTIGSGGPLGLALLVGLPLLAVLEHWIDFRKKQERG